MTTVPIGGPDPGQIARARVRLAALVVVLTGSGLTVLVALALNARELGDRVSDLGVLAIPALALLGAALIVAMIPASLIAGAAGYAIGTAGGTPVSLLAATAGAIGCAALGRHVGAPAARYALGHRVARTVTWLDARPVRSVVTSRLVPGLPFNATSYVLGFTRIGMREIAVGTAVGFAPRCFAYVAMGGSLRELGSPEARIAVGATVLLALLVIVAPRFVFTGSGSTSPREGSHG